MRGAASFVFRCARCSGTPVWVRGSRSSRRCPYRVAVPPVGGGAPPALGGRRAAPVAPQLGWVRGGGGGRHPARSRACVGGGGGSGGGPSVPWRCLLSAKGGGGRLGGPGPGGQPSARGVAPFPRPPLPRAGSSRSPSLGPLIPRPLPRGAGRPGVAVRVSGQWLAGCGAAGFPPRLLSPHSLPREVARRFPWVGNKAGVTWCRAVHGGRGHPYHSGSRPPGFSGHDLRGVPVRRRGPTCSSRPPFEPAAGAWGRVTLRLPSRAGGVHPFCLGGWGLGPPWLAGRWGGGGGAVAPRPPCSRSRRRPVVLLPGSLRVAGALPSGARVRLGLKCRPGVGGVRGGPWTAPLGAPSDLKPSLCHLGAGCGYGRVMWGAASFLLRCARCSSTPVWVRGSRPSRRCPHRTAVPPEGGAPPRPWGGGGPRLWLPCCGGCGGGGGWGGRLPARPRVCAGGGGGLGGALWPPGDASRRPGGRGGGGMAVLVPGASHRPGGRALHPPPLPRAGCSRRPSPGPLPPRPLSRGAGRPGVAVGVSGQWLAGCGAAGSSPRSLSPHSLPREVARPRTSCHTVGGAWVRGPIPPPEPSRTRRLGLHLRRRLCGGWGCGGGGLCRR